MTQGIFISYSRKDKEFAYKLARDLEQRGGEVWVDVGNIPAGTKWRDMLSDAIQNCRAFILVLSKHSAHSEYVNLELALAKEQDKVIIPLRIDDHKKSAALVNQVSEYQFAEFLKGGYKQNVSDLIHSLQAVGIDLKSSEEGDTVQREERWRQRLGDKVPTAWGAVLKKIPGWGAAWGIGWAIFWVVLFIIAALFGGNMSDSQELLAIPLLGIVGGFTGGLAAGTFTMFTLRRFATNIGWKHMRGSIRIWGLIGPICAFAAASVPFVFSLITPVDVPCDGLGECIGAAFASAIGTVLIMIAAALLYGLLAIVVIGMFAGWLAVRHIRRLEPGIRGFSTFWVSVGWAVGALISLFVTLGVSSALMG